MIKPDRHTNPKYSILNISTIILTELNAFYAIKYDNLLNKIIIILGDQAKVNFPYALNFLYLLGKLSCKIIKSDNVWAQINGKKLDFLYLLIFFSFKDEKLNFKKLNKNVLKNGDIFFIFSFFKFLFSNFWSFQFVKRSDEINLLNI